MTTSSPSPDLRSLRTALNGPVLAAGDDGWDDARQAWNLAVDQRPAAIAHATGADDVAAAIRFARANGLRVAPQGTGHAAAPMRPLDATLLLKTSRMRGFRIDPATRTARAEAGALWGDVVRAAGEHGLAPLSGAAADVGVVGHTLGGGIGWLSRLHGLTCNSVTAIELVTAAGERRRVDGDDELFWALRGGGGSFAVVTAIEFTLQPLREVYAGGLFWPVEAAADVLNAYREWTRTVPDEVTSIVRFLNLPPLPQVPAPLRGVPVVDVCMAFAGEAAAGEELLAPLRAVAPPLLDTFATIGVPELTRLHGDPEQPVPGIGHHAVLRELTAEAVDALVGVAGHGSGSPLVSLELRQLGGAMARRAPGSGALAALDGAYALYGVGTPVTPEVGQAVRERLDAVTATLAPWTVATGYLNFAERAVDDAADLFDADTAARLRAVKAAVDPDGLLQANQEVRPAAAA